MCERCGGLMVIDTFCDLMEEESRTGIDTTRCLNCGNFEDTIIRTNRALSRVSRQYEPHIVGIRRPNTMQPRSLERAIPTEGVIAKRPRGRAPRLPVGPPSATIRTREPAHIGPPTPIVPTPRRCT